MNKDLNPTVDDSLDSLSKPLVVNPSNKIHAEVDPSLSIEKPKLRRHTSVRIEEALKVSTCSKLSNLIWSKVDFNKYNTVAEVLFIPFTALQSVRALCFIALSICLGVFFFIKVTTGFHFYSFHSLLVTTIAFFFLFVEFGKQKCYQKREENAQIMSRDMSRGNKNMKLNTRDS